MTDTSSSMAARPPYDVATDDMGITCNIDLQLVPVRLVKSNVDCCVDFLEHRSITTLRRRVQKSPHRDHVLNMLCRRY